MPYFIEICFLCGAYKISYLLIKVYNIFVFLY
jgi:hypothetical protein